MGLQDEGQLTFDINYIPTNTQHVLLRSVRASGTLTNFNITFTDSPASVASFAAYVTGFSISNSVDDVTKASVTLEVSGTVTVA